MEDRVGDGRAPSNKEGPGLAHPALPTLNLNTTAGPADLEEVARWSLEVDLQGRMQVVTR